jgi:hypothetical protein
MIYARVACLWMILLMIASQGVQAQVRREIPLRVEASADPYYQISSMVVTTRKLRPVRISKTVLSQLHSEFLKESYEWAGQETVPHAAEEPNPLGIADLFLKAWAIIQEDKPTLNVDTHSLKALPYIAKDHWKALTGWGPEHGIEVKLALKNGYGIKVVQLVYEVRLIYGGSVKKHGRYIASARVVPKFVDVMWGFGLDVAASEVAVQNLNTEEDPMAAITLDLRLAYGSVLRKVSETVSYQFQGNGVIRDLTSKTNYFEP